MVSTVHVALGAQQPAESRRCRARDRSGSTTIDVGERLRQVLGLAHVVDDLADRPERRHGHEVRLHETAGGLFRDIRGCARARRDRRCGICARISCRSARSRFSEQVGGVVGLELGDGLGQHVLGQRRQELVAHGLVELGEHLGVERRRPAPRPAATRCVGLQQLDQIGEVGRLQVLARSERTMRRQCPPRAPRRPAAPARTSARSVPAPALAAVSSCMRAGRPR